MKSESVVLVWCLAVLISTVTAGRGSPPSPSGLQFFESKVRPILAENCFKCHGPKKQEGGLRLDPVDAALPSGDQGPVVVPGKPEESRIITAIGYDDPDLKMPPSKKLAAEQIAALTQWVKMGAPWPAAKEGGAAAPKTRRGEFRISDADRAHWAFQPATRPLPPTVTMRDWVSNPIDTFILARLQAKGLRPNPPAGKRELIRRAYYDLTGLPPTPVEVETFEADPSPRAYEALIDRLLGSSHYGEKWGRHWLDLVRFAETNSYERDGPKPNAWRFRDYVIRSFNADKPYDQFVREQLAGDELAARMSPSANDDVLSPEAVEALIATGYFRLGIWDDEPTDRDQARYDGLDDVVATTSQVFLGLTVDCARCHDHKIDPIAQKDYYRLLAFFHNVNHYSNGGPNDEAPIFADAASKRAFEAKVQAAPKDKRHEHKPPSLLRVTEAGPVGPETFVLLRGNPRVRGPKVEPGFPLVLGGGNPTILPPARAARSSGRRTALANWIASTENPLAARVIANRVWQYHFGRGIVRSPNNFGLQGDKPTHPDLLDWLAAAFVESGWRLKPLHKLIMTSSAYRMSSRGADSALAADPANDLIWRFDMRRLSAEEIRDSILAVNGTLNPKMYGPGIFVEIPQEVLAGQSVPGSGWGASATDEQNRRSVYIHIKRSLITPILESFDVAETDRSAPVRFATTQPTQALGMLNSKFLGVQAERFAQRLQREAGTDPDQQVQLALRLVTSRKPTNAEVRRGRELLSALTKGSVTAEVALKYFCLMTFNLNEFVYLD